MKIYVSTDLEGVTGVYGFHQTREPGTPANLEARRLLMGDIAAVAEGLKEASVAEILVWDGHGAGPNFIPELMMPGVRYIMGKCPGGYGLDESCDGVVLLGFHAMNGTQDGVLHHTQNSRLEKKYWYDGVDRGEIYQEAVIVGHYEVPVILVTGDEAACREARETLGEAVPTVAVKKGICREAAVLIAPEETRELLKTGAKAAVAAIPDLKPYHIKRPVELRWRCKDEGSPENPYYVERVFTIDDPLKIVSAARK